MAECAKILSQFNRGTSAVQHYVGLRPMFDVEVINEDSKSVLGEQNSTPNPVDVNVALSECYKQITGKIVLTVLLVCVSCINFIQPANLAANAKAVFACLLDQMVKEYTTEGLGRSREGLKEAAFHTTYANSISRLLLPVDGAHAPICEEMAATMSSVENSVCQGLHQCIKIVISERLLTAEQKATDCRSVDNSLMADHRATSLQLRVQE
ncbi:Exocyst complex component Sec10-like protein [Artemisia annua]|uniref:Exocyst complex component Sec10-like protein n=1 Tax=Artemisia annua TaxID=35608 RepID=A0A2U1KF42_ARTAN|nr:Exocyst complex component Sec10-like protein [Artemisia annua]